MEWVTVRQTMMTVLRKENLSIPIAITLLNVKKRRSCHGELGRRRDYMKPGKFDGNSCFETFLSQFDNCAQYNRWSDTDKLHYLRWSLTGAVAGMLWGTEEMSYGAHFFCTPYLCNWWPGCGRGSEVWTWKKNIKQNYNVAGANQPKV